MTLLHKSGLWVPVGRKPEVVAVHNWRRRTTGGKVIFRAKQIRRGESGGMKECERCVKEMERLREDGGVARSK